MPATRPAEDRAFLADALSMRREIQRFADSEKPEVRTAIEELRAQNETLVDACNRLERESAKYRDLYDSAPDALVTTDERGVIVDANLATATLLGFPHQRLPGKLLVGFVARGDTTPFRHRLREIVDGDGWGAFWAQIRPRGGRPFLAHLSVRAVEDPVRVVGARRARPVAFHWTIRVETGSHRHQGAVSDLLEIAADELRAPVTAVLGWAHLLRDGSLHEQERASVFAALAESAQAQKALIDQIGELVALARDTEPAATVNLADIAQDAADRARPAAVARSVLVAVERKDEDPRTRARADHLAWALDSLLARAVQAASSPGAVDVRIGVRELHATLHVRVSGAPALGGSRLAVAVARAAIERQGGALRVPELAEDGVVLELRLPLTSG